MQNSRLKKISANTAALSWLVSSADNVREFTVTKSSDCKNFKSIASIKFSGIKGYSFNDNCLDVGANYYRLVTVDRDGSAHFSNIVSVIKKESGITLLFLAPNLVHSITTLNISSTKADNVKVGVVNLLGRTIQQKRINIPEGNSQASFDFSTLKAGSYFLQIVSLDGSIITTRFQKQ